MKKIEKGTKFIIGDNKCNYGVYIALKDIDLENEIYNAAFWDEKNPYSLEQFLNLWDAGCIVNFLTKYGYIKLEEQFPYLNLCDNSVSLESYPSWTYYETS